MEPSSPLNVHDLVGCLVRSKFPIGEPTKVAWERFAAEVNKLLVPAPDGPNVRKQIERWKRKSWAESQPANAVAQIMIQELERALAADAQKPTEQER
jgi:hypothetical protein